MGYKLVCQVNLPMILLSAFLISQGAILAVSSQVSNMGAGESATLLQGGGLHWLHNLLGGPSSQSAHSNGLKGEILGECFSDDHMWWFHRIFPKLLYEDDKMTPGECIEACRLSKGRDEFKFAGLQYGKQCFCSKDTPPSDKLLPREKCNMPCAGDKDFICGGFFKMSVY